MIKKWLKKRMEQPTNITEKKELRRWISEKKRKLTSYEIQSRSKQIFEQLCSLPELMQAERVYAYVSYNQEVDTLPFLQYVLDCGKILLVPKVYGQEMEFHEIRTLEELEPGAFGIPEPVTEMIDSSHAGFMLLPGLAFDQNGHRMGYGGGFYDKYLSKHRSFYKVAAAYDFQIMEYVPTEQRDISVDAVVTERQIFQCNKEKCNARKNRYSD